MRARVRIPSLTSSLLKNRSGTTQAPPIVMSTDAYFISVRVLRNHSHSHVPKRCYYFLCNSREECGQRRHICPIFDTSIPGADEYDGRNALGCRDLFCEKYFEANPGKNVIYATYYGTPDL